MAELLSTRANRRHDVSVADALPTHMLGVTTEELLTRVASVGAEQVGRELERLGPDWAILSTAEIGDWGIEADHMVIGPPGLITVHTKRHPQGRARVDARKVRVNGHVKDHLSEARRGVTRVEERLLALGAPVAVRSVVVLVDLDEVFVRQMPGDVHVTAEHELVDWLVSLPATTGPDDVAAVVARTRRGATIRR